ncbi:MAG TPA: signal peptidase I [Candidatus Paceibacterota bacterium]|nr:signal peptidase I [Candidatus Paceibacterota bacterium]
MNNIDLRTGNPEPNVPEESPEPVKKPTKLAQIIDALRYIFIALIVVIPVRAFVAQPFIVQGNSMYPTLHNHEYLIVNEMVKLTQDYRRGDVVILHYPNDPSRYFVKRIIGLPGETVSFEGTTVTISGPTHPKPFVLDEPYVADSQKMNNKLTRTLSNDEFFVCGDNRSQSSDSRIWGPVPRNYMDGRALIRLFPFSVIALNPGSLSEFGSPYAADHAPKATN